MFTVETTLIFVVWTPYRVVDEVGNVYEGGMNIPNKLYLDIHPGAYEGSRPNITNRWVPLEEVTVNRLVNMGIKPVYHPSKN